MPAELLLLVIEGCREGARIAVVDKELEGARKSIRSAWRAYGLRRSEILDEAHLKLERLEWGDRPPLEADADVDGARALAEGESHTDAARSETEKERPGSKLRTGDIEALMCHPIGSPGAIASPDRGLA